MFMTTFHANLVATLLFDLARVPTIHPHLMFMTTFHANLVATLLFDLARVPTIHPHTSILGYQTLLIGDNF